MNALLRQFKILSGQICDKKKDKRVKLKNKIGEKIMENTFHLLKDISQSFFGPYKYNLLELLCKRNSCQAIFSSLMPQPSYIFPQDRHPHSQSVKPTIYLRETVNLNSKNSHHYHVDLIIRPDMVFKKKIPVFHLPQNCNEWEKPPILLCKEKLFLLLQKEATTR